MTSAPRQRAWLPTPSGLFGSVLFLILVTARGTKLLVDGDTYTHITSGTWMLAHGRILDIDIFSHTVAGMPWTAHEWGAQVLMAWLNQAGGLAAVAIFFAVIASLSLTHLYRLLERQNASPWVALGLMTATLILVYPHIFARPHLFTWLFGIATFDLLQREGRCRWLLPFIMIPWVNLHGGFILGLALQCVFLTGRLLDRRIEIGWRNALAERQPDLLALVASLAACLLNPFGVNIFLFYGTVSAIGITQYNPEWMALDFQGFWPYRLYLVGLLFVLLCARRRPDWVSLLLLAAFLDASLAHRRHISMAAMFLAPLWLQLLPARISFPHRIERAGLHLSAWSGPFLQIGAAGTLILMLTFAAPARREALAQHFPISARFPHKAWGWVEEYRPTGRVFNEYSWGAFLIYRTKGDIPVFIDGFADKYGEQIYGDYYRIVQLEMETEDLLTKYEISWIFFPTDTPLIRYLAETGRWETAYADDQASVLVLREGMGE